ncbi:MAG: MFS transporter [Rhodocyclaceae bacterium]
MKPAEYGSRAYRKITLAISIGGFSNFALLYGAQPLMPNFSHEFGLPAAGASGVISMATGAMALSLIPASVLADRLGKRALMLFSVFASAFITLLCCAVDDFSQLLVLRALLGISLACLPAVAIAYLSEEIDSRHVGRAIGLYIAGNALGSMGGRFLAAIVADASSWRLAMAVLGGITLVAAGAFAQGLPSGAERPARRCRICELMAAARSHFADAGLPWLFVTGFILMGCFVSVFNYLAYRLGTAPFGFSQSKSSLIYALNAAGIFASAWAGALADRLGRRNVLWILVACMLAGLLLTLPDSVLCIYAGTALLSFGFFGGHSVASSWLGFRALQHKALATALYLSIYYLGSSLLGAASGLMWSAQHWDGVVLLLGTLLSACLLIALRLRGLVPRSPV